MAAAKVVVTYKRRRVLPEGFIPQGNDHPDIAQDPLVEVAITNASIVSVAEGNKAENPREDSEVKIYLYMFKLEILVFVLVKYF